MQTTEIAVHGYVEQLGTSDEALRAAFSDIVEEIDSAFAGLDPAITEAVRRTEDPKLPGGVDESRRHGR